MILKFPFPSANVLQCHEPVDTDLI